jgi:hypothetical protein
VCAGLARWLPDAPVVPASRRARGPAAARVDVRDAASLRAVLVRSGAAALVDAVGPYEYDPGPLVAACADAGVPWIDLADRERFLARAEAAAGAAPVASGASAAPGLVEAFAAALARRGEVARLASWFSVGSRKDVSAALLYALLRPLGRALPEAPALAVPGAPVGRDVLGATFWFGRHAWPRGAGGARVGSRRVEISHHVGMDRRGQQRALRALAPTLGALPERVLWPLCRAARPLAPWIARLGGETGALRVEALDGAGRVVDRIEVRALRGLELAALPAVWAAEALAAGPSPRRGALALHELWPPAALAARMREAGWDVAGL